jgi:manganese/iron transport system ATP-binding protein
VLDVCHLSACYRGRLALDDVCLHLHPGESVALLGPNGAGKSTLIKAILGLLPVTSGQVQFAGRPVAQCRQRIAYVPQRSQIDWDYPITAHGIVHLGATRCWWPWGHYGIERRTQHALDLVQMTDLGDRPLNELSGGQQQRVFLARALAQEADLYLLDEPFAGVDRRTESLMHEVFQQLIRAGRTVLVCSHEWGSSLQRYSRLVLINRRVIACGPYQQVLTPGHLQQAYGEDLPLNNLDPTVPQHRQLSW